jgi:hypothetical protein
MAVHLCQSLFGIFAHLETDETETFALSSVPVLDDVGSNNSTERLEECSEIVLVGIGG